MRFPHNLVLLSALIAALSGCGGSASVPPIPKFAQTAFAFPGGKGGQLVSPGFDAVEGNLFKVSGSSDLRVTALGYEYVGPTQILGQTAIFDANDNVLASTVFTSSDTVADGYYWRNINPITLKAGQQYYIGSLHGTGDGYSYYWNTRTATLPAGLTDLGTYFKDSSSFTVGNWAWGGGTSQYGPGEIRHYVGNFKLQ